MKIAFSGFRHAHIDSLYQTARARDDLTIIAACEDHEETRQAIISGKRLAPTNIEESRRTGLAETEVVLTHHSLDELLAETDCDIVAVGDYYSRRGSLIIKALKAGKHVIADKPICTSLSELDEIEELVAESDLKIGCMLDLRDSGAYIGARELIRAGELGDILAISFGGQHPLMYGTRPNWYFEEGKHGGTINDIAIHALDAIPWITGLEFSEINAARCWNAMAEEVPFFQDAAQMMVTMNNGCGVLGDVSYFVPNSLGYSHPFYWRFTFWGTKAVMEISATSENIIIGRNGNNNMEKLPIPAGTPHNYLQCFLDEINGLPQKDGLTTKDVLRSSRTTLMVQEAADKKLCNVKI